MANIVYIATSLDGYIAGPDGELDWLDDIPNPDHSDYGYAEFIKGIDAIVMGRKTFDIVMSFDSWPYTKPVFVLSNSLKELPRGSAKNAEIISGELSDILKRLQDNGYHTLYIDGGRTIQSFLAEDLIDTMIIARIPIILGKGIPLFGEQTERLKFRHVKTEVHSNALVMTEYLRDR